MPTACARRKRPAPPLCELIGSSLTPDKIVTQKSVENALRVLLAIGGSTNAVIHLTAIAGRAGVPVSLAATQRARPTRRPCW